MSAKYFLDTNIFVYSIDPAFPSKADIATKLIRKAVVDRQGVISYQVVQEFFNIATRKFEQPLTLKRSEEYLTTILRPLLAVHSSTSLFNEALQLRHRYRLAWNDSLVVAAAVQARCSTLYSEDLQHGFAVGGMRVENPFV